MSERFTDAFMAAVSVAGAAFFFALLQQGAPLESADVLFAFLYSGLAFFSIFFAGYSVYGTLKSWFEQVAERMIEDRTPPTSSPSPDALPPTKAGNTPETPVSQPETGVSQQNQWKKLAGEGEADYVGRLRSYRNGESDEQYIATLLREGVSRRYIYQIIPGRNETVSKIVESVSRNMVFIS